MYICTCNTQSMVIRERLWLWLSCGIILTSLTLLSCGINLTSLPLLSCGINRTSLTLISNGINMTRHPPCLPVEKT